MMSDSEEYESYEDVIERIRGLGKRTIEDRFAIGRLVTDLLSKGYDIDKIAAEVGISAKTLSEYADIAAWWGEQRVLDCASWGVYLTLLRLPLGPKEKRDLTAAAAELGAEVILNAELDWRLADSAVERSRVRERLLRTLPDRVTRHMWDTVTLFEELDFESLTEDQKAHIGRAGAALIRMLRKLKG